MSFRNNQETKKEFFKQLFIGGAGAVILLILLGLWLGWDSIYVWFYNQVAHIPKEVRVGDPLLIGWLIFLFPLLAAGIALLVSGGLKAYKLACLFAKR